MPDGVPLVLIIDDDGLTRETVRDGLAQAGLASVDAKDGVDGLGQLRRGLRPSVILLDMVMPRLDGASFLREVRADADLARIPVITMSACAAWTDGLDVRARVRKPIDFDDLVYAIESACEGSPAVQ